MLESFSRKQITELHALIDEVLNKTGDVKLSVLQGMLQSKLPQSTSDNTVKHSHVVRKSIVKGNVLCPQCGARMRVVTCKKSMEYGMFKCKSCEYLAEVK